MNRENVLFDIEPSLLRHVVGGDNTTQVCTFDNPTGESKPTYVQKQPDYCDGPETTRVKNVRYSIRAFDMLSALLSGNSMGAEEARNRQPATPCKPGDVPITP